MTDERGYQGERGQVSTNHFEGNGCHGRSLYKGRHQQLANCNPHIPVFIMPGPFTKNVGRRVIVLRVV